MWPLLLQNHWKKLATVFALLMCFGSGAYVGHKYLTPSAQVSVTEKEKIVAVEVEKKQIKTNKNTVIVTKPDGTKTETITENTETKEETAKNTTKESTSVVAKASRYRLGVFAERDISDLLKKPLVSPSLGVSAGAKVIGDVWIDSTYNFSTKDLTIGVSIQF